MHVLIDQSTCMDLLTTMTYTLCMGLVKNYDIYTSAAILLYHNIKLYTKATYVDRFSLMVATDAPATRQASIASTNRSMSGSTGSSSCCKGNKHTNSE